MAASERVILMVDDMEQMTSIGADFLQRRLEGARVVTFNKPKDALAWLKTAPRVDMVLSDNHMGDMDGVTLLEQSKALHPHAARVLMTAYLDIVATPPQLGARGIQALIRKPFEWNDFVRALFEIFAQSPEERALAEREGPIAFPEGAFAEFAASRNAKPADRAGAGAGAGTRTVAVSAAGMGSSPAATAIARSLPQVPASAPVAPVQAPAPAPSAPAPAPAVLRLAATPGRAKVGCPHCHGEIQLELLLPSARPGGAAAPTDDAEAKRLLAYLQARPGVAQRLRQMAQNPARK